MRHIIEKAEIYDSVEELKANDLPTYLLARKNRLLTDLFPPEYIAAPKPGIYFLYKGLKVVYMGLVSSFDAEQSMRGLLEDNSHIKADSYKIFHPHSSADMRVLYHYLVAKYKPKYNNDVVSDLLTIHIPEATKLLGPATKGEL
jgi:hypothetical protein